MKKITPFAWIIAALALMTVGCGDRSKMVISTPILDIKSTVQSLSAIESLTVMVTSNKLKSGKEFTCKQLLDGKVKFQEKDFQIEKKDTAVLDPQEEKKELVFSELSVGKKLFIAVGYLKKDNKQPDLIGCSEGTVEPGKRLFLSIFLVPYKK